MLWSYVTFYLRVVPYVKHHLWPCRVIEMGFRVEDHSHCIYQISVTFFLGFLSFINLHNLNRLVSLSYTYLYILIFFNKLKFYKVLNPRHATVAVTNIYICEYIWILVAFITIGFPKQQQALRLHLLLVITPRPRQSSTIRFYNPS